MHHCTTPTTCHTHTIQTFTGSRQRNALRPRPRLPVLARAPTHGHRRGGLSATTSIRLDPKTVDLTFASSPTGLTLTVGSSSSVAPFTRTVIVNSLNTISAPTSRHSTAPPTNLQLVGPGRRDPQHHCPGRPGDLHRHLYRLGWWFGAGEFWVAGCVWVGGAGAGVVCFGGCLVWVAVVVCVPVAAVWEWWGWLSGDWWCEWVVVCVVGG